MYKTIRHGENSLQYTILPQNDDFRLDGKISGTGGGGGGVGVGGVGHKTKRGRKRSFFAYLGLIFVCTVIIGAILIPFLVSAECLPNPSDWFLKAKVALTSSRHDLISSNALTKNDDNEQDNNNSNNNKTESTIKAYLDSNQQNIDTTSDIIHATTVKQDTIIVATSLSSDNIYPTSNSKKKILNSQRYNNVVVPTEGIVMNEDQKYIVIDSDRNKNEKKTTPRTITTTKTTITTIKIPSTSIQSVAQLKDTTEESLKITSSGSGLTSQSMKTSTKKPIILPVLAKTNSVVRENGKFIDRHTETKNWIRSHWPFIDPSSYFQWAGYKSEDSVLLPAILGLALIGMVLIVILCFIVRHKNRIDTLVRKRNRNNTEESGEDNTTLLTTGNTSDDD